MWMFSKKNMWWLISGLNAVHLASLPAQLCPLLQLSHKPPPSGCQHQSLLQGFKPTEKQTNCTARAHTCVHTFVYFSSHETWAHTLFVLLLFFFLCAALSLTRKHTQGSRLFIESLWVGVGGTMAALLHQAQTRSQINILSPAGQPVQAGLSASESLSPGFHIKERKKKQKTVAGFNSACWRAQIKSHLSFVNDSLMLVVCVLAARRMFVAMTFKHTECYIKVKCVMALN